MADKVTTADIVPVGRAVPAGMPPDLLRATVLVYSDLVSRRAAMQTFANAGPTGRSADVMLGDLGRGHAAAERFDTDLAALRSLAAGAAPFEPAAPDDRARAEVLLLVRYTDAANLGCDSRGGVVLTELPAIVWSETPPPGIDPSWQHHGTIGHIDFSANLVDGTWKVQLWAC